MWMLMTGGEILLRSDFVDLYRYAKKKGFLITLFTNGTLLTADLVDFLRDWYPFEVEVSLYGLTPETYKKVTGSAAAYERAMHGVRMLAEARMPLRLKSMAMTLTKEELPAMYDLAADLGVQFYHDGMIWQTFYGKDISELRLSPEDVVAFDLLHPTSAEDFLRVYHRHNRIVETSRSHDAARLYNCGAGHRSFYIDPYGQLGLCQAVRPALYDLTAGTFQQGWELLGEFRASARATRDFPCMRCDIAGLCRRCSARSIQEHGEAETVVEHACAVAHLRAQRLGLASQSVGFDQVSSGS
jgi:radical SAM protein with 4Fe4S-binding SPASM domain